MRVLAIDTATSSCSVAMWGDGDILARRAESMPRGQSEALMGMIADVLSEAELDMSAIDLLAVTIGPGAFTGIRIGLAAARGLALASGLPLLGVTTTEAIAAAIKGNNIPLLVALDSKRADIFIEVF
ncbi:MAG: tRNA (adenosine(37)-N6)-threonylcarbamoyltransferase complex dimerization subunit type 1 TsaB, partial [Alphaproteobacteria bacterium]